MRAGDSKLAQGSPAVNVHLLSGLFRAWAGSTHEGRPPPCTAHKRRAGDMALATRSASGREPGCPEMSSGSLGAGVAGAGVAGNPCTQPGTWARGILAPRSECQVLLSSESQPGPGSPGLAWHATRSLH